MDSFFRFNESDTLEDILDVWTSSAHSVRKDMESSEVLYDIIDSSSSFNSLYRWIGAKKDGDPVYKAKVGGEVCYDLISTTTEDYHDGSIPYDNEDGSMGFFYHNCKAVLHIVGAHGYEIPLEYSNGFEGQGEVITYGIFVLKDIHDDVAEWEDHNSGSRDSKKVKVYELEYLDDSERQNEYRDRLLGSKVEEDDPVERLIKKGMLEKDGDSYIAHFPSRKNVLKNVESLDDYDSDISSILSDGRFIVPISEWNGYLSFRYLKSWENFPRVINGDVEVVSDISGEGSPVEKCTGEYKVIEYGKIQ